LDDLNSFTQNEYTHNMIEDTELQVLKRLDWCLTAVTPLHFLGYYCSKVRRAPLALV
jgi:hypothetical protein